MPHLVKREKLFWILFAALALMVLGFGGVYLWVQRLVVFVFGVLLLGAVYLQRRDAKAFVAPMTLLVCFWLVLLALQALPLPPRLLAIVAPGRFAIFNQVQALTGLTAAPVSMSTLALLQSALLGGLYISVFWLARYVFEYEDLRPRMMRCFTWLASGFALVAIAQTVFFQGLAGFATFIGKNHGAIFLAILLPFALVLFLAAEDKRARFIYGAHFLVQVLGCLVSASRFSIVATVLATLVTVTLYVMWMKRSRTSMGGLVLLLIVVIFYVFKVLGVQDLVLPASELSIDTVSRGYRIDLWRDAIRAWFESPLLGFGVGSFEGALSVFRTFDSFVRAEHAESELIEVLVTSGALGFALLAVLGWRIARQALRAERDYVDTAVCASLIVVVFASGVHFFYEVPAISCCVAIVLAMLFCRVHRHDRSEIVKALQVPIVVTVGIGMLVLGLTVSDRGQCENAFQQSVERLDGLRGVELQAESLIQAERAQACLAKAPNSFLSYLWYGAMKIRSGAADSEAVSALQTAAFLNPKDPRAAFFLGQALFANDELDSAERALKDVNRLAHSAPADGVRESYRLLAAIAIKRLNFDKANEYVDHYVGYSLGKDSAAVQTDAAYMRFLIAMAQADKTAGRFWASKAYATTEQMLQPIATQLNDLGAREQRLFFNGMLLSAGDVMRAIAHIDALLEPARVEEVWGSTIFAFLPERSVDAEQTMRRLAGSMAAAVKQSDGWNVNLQDWFYRIEVDYPANESLADYFGVETNMVVTSPQFVVEVFVESPYRPRKQLEIRVFNDTFGERILKNKQSLPLGDGWYALTVEFDDLPDIGKDVQWTIKSVGFNTAGINGPYQLSSFRFYDRSTR